MQHWQLWSHFVRNTYFSAAKNSRATLGRVPRSLCHARGDTKYTRGVAPRHRAAGRETERTIRRLRDRKGLTCVRLRRLCSKQCRLAETRFVLPALFCPALPLHDAFAARVLSRPQWWRFPNLTAAVVPLIHARHPVSHAHAPAHTDHETPELIITAATYTYTTYLPTCTIAHRRAKIASDRATDRRRHHVDPRGGGPD